jgi:transcriptional regulator with XRE-family HTH domain
MEAKGWSVKRFADEIGRTPEHARKISTGLAFPSDDLAMRIAQKLDIDHEEFRKQLAEDRWEKKYKKKPPESEHTNLGRLENVWAELNAGQRELVLCVAICLKAKKRKRA